MRYKEIISESDSPTVEKMGSYLRARGFVRQGDPKGEMGEWGGSPQYYYTYEFAATMPADEAEKFQKAFLSKLKRENLKDSTKVKTEYIRNPGKNNGYSVKLNVLFKWAGETPAPTDRPLIKIPYFTEETFAVGDDVEIRSAGSDGTKLGIIGVGGPTTGTVVKDNGDGSYVIRPSTNHPRNDSNDFTAPASSLLLIDTYWDGAAPSNRGKFKPRSEGVFDVNDYVEYALHPSKQGTVTLTGVSKADNHRYKITNGYIDQIYSRFMQRGQGYRFSGRGVVPDKTWWDSLSPAEKQRYAVK